MKIRSNITDITKNLCRDYLKKNDQLDFSSFDQLEEHQQNLHTIKINQKQWQLSECTCYTWSKNLKCKHVIAIASRLNLCSFDQIAMNLPLEPKKRRGRRPKRGAALIRDDPIEQFEDNLNIEEYGEETVAVIRNVLLPRASKRLKLKKLFFFCHFFYIVCL